MTKVEKFANRLLQERGYIVVAKQWPSNIGETFDFIGDTDNILPHKTTVVAVTDVDDFAEQLAMDGRGLPPSIDYYLYFYRVVAE